MARQLSPALACRAVERTLALVGRFLRARVHGLNSAVLALLTGLVLAALLGTVRRQRLPEAGAAFQDIKDSVETARMGRLIRRVGPVC